MNYSEAIDFLFRSLPMYQRVGSKAFKKDLSNTLNLCEALGNPQHKFKSIHVAGTNGKGSSSHMLAAILQSCGYKVGLYTSPHLKSFTERIKVNGFEIPKADVTDFVNGYKKSIDQIKPSFFEMTVAMAFNHFAKEAVDIAVIEVGLGGRLDSTNIIIPEVSLITNIGLDHTDMLGNTLSEIAGEKAGIIKESVPVVISERQPETSPVFEKVAREKNSPIHYSDDENAIFQTDLKGNYQQKNLKGVLKVTEVLRNQGWKIPKDIEITALKNISRITNLKGRWSQLNDKPITICDTGHNVEAFQYIIDQLNGLEKNKFHMILGFVQDKNVEDLLSMIPKHARLTFCQSSVPRAMPLEELKALAVKKSIEASYIPNVNIAIAEVSAKAGIDDVIFVGGSTFVVAEIDML